MAARIKSRRPDAGANRLEPSESVPIGGETVSFSKIPSQPQRTESHADEHGAQRCAMGSIGVIWAKRHKGMVDFGVVGSNPIARSNSLLKLKSLPGGPDRYGFATPRRSSPGHHRGIESAMQRGLLRRSC